MSIIHLSAVASQEPSAADLAGIEQEWPLIAAELGQRRFAAPVLSERQLRRIVYS